VSTQLALRFDEVEVDCPVQQRYHAIAPCLAEKRSPAAQARSLNVAYSTVTHWLRQFRRDGMPGLFPASEYPREPYTPERIIVTVLYYKCCAPRASDRELARAVGNATGHRLHNETVKALLERYFFWRYAEFRRTVQYPVRRSGGAPLRDARFTRTAGRSARLRCCCSAIRTPSGSGCAVLAIKSAQPSNPCSPTYRVRPITRTAKCRWV
jgi:transposase